MANFEDLKNKTENLCVVGLGYVGLPLAVLLSKHFSVIGFDVNKKRIEELKEGYDHTKEVLDNDLSEAQIQYSFNLNSINKSKFIIIAVPTPINENNEPDLILVKKATETVGRNLAKGSVVVYESTVYPGVTEDVCLPILEKESGLVAGEDFKVGYSPERVNPGDRKHTIDKITKVVSGMDKESVDLISDVYSTITNTFKAESIKVAEAAKVIENTQRDLNIALVNELSIIFKKFDISVYDVLEAAGTKWNFLPFKPGLVGGHCIGVDPYYLTYRAEKLGYKSEVILAGRGINDSMHIFISNEINKEIDKLNINRDELKIGILGLTFKENVPDIRNSKVFELYKELKKTVENIKVYDPHADKEKVEKEYGIILSSKDDIKDVDVLIVAVAHDEFKKYSLSDLEKMFKIEKCLFVDIKKIYNKNDLEKSNINYWSL